ncbi:MAG: response regulator, partial [Chloroflexales bacterium]|nr:response regulator [Chloroflexales bacterium]
MDILPALTQLETVYHAQLPEKVEQLVAACRLLLGSSWKAEQLPGVHRLAHNLSGSGATFGYHTLSEAAHALEQALLPLRDQPMPPTPEQVGAIARCLSLLQQATLSPDTGLSPSPSTTSPSPSAAASPHTRAQTLVIVDDDQDEATSLALQLSYFGYRVLVRTTAADLAELVRAEQPAALLLDLTLSEGELAGAETARGLRDQALLPPTIFLSRRTDLPARLETVRAGGSAYFARPVDLNELVRTLDRLTQAVPPSPARVLIVDDSVIIAHAHAAFLRAAGMDVVTVTDPQNLLPVLAEQQPDLVLMDMYLPGCEGQELASVIRQQPAFHGMPIVFLSGETDRERQLLALGQGGDDFLTKPVTQAHLVAAVTSRIERARMIRGQLNRDSLTGLLTHAAFKEQLVRESARASRTGMWLSVVMLDVDHFKRVNDTHGHAAGDRVLTSLARLLQQHLRASDVVGRYGGEEFAVLLPDTDGAGALTVLERIRTQFAGVQHQGAHGTPFTVTFSAGIASVPPYSVAERLLEAADATLYAAKQRGRNCVLQADALRLPAVALTASKLVPAPSIPPSEHLGPEQRATRALIVDDDEDLRAVLHLWLSGWGWDVEALATGAEALQRLDAMRPDVVLLDALMPGLGGLDVLTQIRSRERDLAVVMITAFSSEQLVTEALRQGADDYVRKPLNPSELRTVLERTLGRLQLRRENTLLQRRLADDVRHAARVQANLLPATPPPLQGYSLAARCLPAREVGGDFYDWHVTDEGALILTLADVMGKGMPAALLMSTARATLRALRGIGSALATVNAMAEVLAPDLDRLDSFITLF